MDQVKLVTPEVQTGDFGTLKIQCCCFLCVGVYGKGFFMV